VGGGHVEAFENVEIGVDFLITDATKADLLENMTDFLDSLSDGMKMAASAGEWREGEVEERGGGSGSGGGGKLGEFGFEGSFEFIE
jgi:hypothetical protein